MANCIKCGRKLPAFTFGKLRNVCKWCVEYEAMQENGVEDDARQHVMPAPWASGASDSMIVTKIFAGICAAVFVGMALSSEGKSVMDVSSQFLIDWGADYGPLTISGDWWRLITSTFLHIGIIHIALNMWCLWDLGAMAESLYGHWTFAAVYLICGLAGSVASIAYHPATVSAGASGAVFGIAGALIASLKLGKFSMPHAAVKGTLSSVVSFAIYNLIFGAVSGRVDNAAHIGGFVAGLVMGGLIALLAAERDHAIRRITLLTLVVLVVAGGAGLVQRARGANAREYRISALIGMERYDQAKSELEKKLARNPSDVANRLELARVYYFQNRDAEQETELKRILAIAPSGESAREARFYLGLLYSKQRKFSESKELYSEMLAVNPSDLDARLGLGTLYLQQNDYAAALQQFETVAKAQPQTERLYYDMGRSYAELKKYDEAIVAYRNAQQIDGDDADIESALGDAYQAKGMAEQAEAARRAAESFRNRENQD